MVEMLATSCVTSRVPMLFIVDLSLGNANNALMNVRLGETKLLRLSWLMICGHVSLYHQG
jgi:hypothetical protein